MTTAPHNPKKRFDEADGSLEERLYGQMTLIRQLEERLLELFEQGVLFGTTHCYIGQEADAVGVINHLTDKDIVFSNHRCHGHYLAYADAPERLLAELMGKETGVVGGRGGSQHLCEGNFYTNGVQGGIVPGAVGMALSEKLRGRGGIATVFIGDGTLGEGSVYESLNMASLWDVPVLVVIENNRWAQSTPTHLELAGDMVARAKAFGIDAGQIESTDPKELYAHFGPIVDKVRTSGRPHVEVIHTYRLCHHSKSDDKRPEEEIERFRKGDPIPTFARVVGEDRAQLLDEVAKKRVDEAQAWAEAQPFPDPSDLVEPAPTMEYAQASPSGSKNETVLASLNDAHHRILGSDPLALLMGEDLLDPYGGAFKVAKGLSTKYPDQVRTTPISEAGFVGVACGLAMRGHKPIVEIMFGDFLALAMDQVLNHITKYRWMYNNQVQVPLVIRAPMGGRRGYGPTHSQSIEKHLMGIAGLVTVAPHPFSNPGRLLVQAAEHDPRPVLFVENKLMYSRPLRASDSPGVSQRGNLFYKHSDAPYPTTTLSHSAFDEADVTIVAYGGMAELAVSVAEKLLLEDELVAEVVLPTQLSDIELGPVADSLSRSGKLLVVEEGIASHGFGSEVCARMCESHWSLLQAEPKRVGALPVPIANTASLEQAILPSEEQVLVAARDLANRSATPNQGVIRQRAYG